MPTRSLPLFLLASASLLPIAAGAAEAPVSTQWGMVSEPQMPSTICATLKADIVSQKGSVDAYDADGRNTHPDQARIQSAIDQCKGGAVKLVAEGGKDAFLTGPLKLKSHVTLWIDKGVTLFASRDPKDYDNGPGDCGMANTVSKKSCYPLIHADKTEAAGIVGEGAIDGRGGSLLLTGPNAGKRSWWDVAWQSKQGLIQHNPRLLQIDGGSHFTLYGTAFMNSANFHIVADGVNGVTAWGIRILTPNQVYTVPDYACPKGTTPDKLTPATCITPDTVKNTDGFDPGQSSEVLLAYSFISTGDDNVAIKASARRPAAHMTFAHNHFFYGHGMSIGSETASGDEDIHVYDLSLDGFDSPNGNGIRVKSDSSRGGKVTGVLFEDVCMRGQRAPLVFDTRYSDAKGKAYPDFADITLRNIHILEDVKHPQSVLVLRGWRDAERMLPVNIRFDNVVFEGRQPRLAGAPKPDQEPKPIAANVTLGPGPVSFADQLKADEVAKVTVKDERSGKAALRDCSNAFPSFKSVIPGAPI
ncbi:glycoside hydrolase family 28 protein [Rhizobium oryzicola]|uniref:Glycoside hydrolase family 28 protein n=1 Tax=Rhizobium oryzicola TaxID=1232668 RepID=A0ABT8SVC6_9HYPH|nr:glycoside hydrolase family 28 protein [Rhizobium oryzicola]MDO1581662.1 glycoside hydrolase family 28 protein [Rhizobium oryzicola]